MSITTNAWHDDYDFSSLFKIQEAIAQAANRISVVFSSDTLETIKLYKSYLDSISLPSEALLLQVSEYYDILSKYQSIELPIKTLNYISEALKLYNSPTIIEQMKYITSVFAAKVDPDIIKVASSIDLSEYQLDDNDDLSYNGVQYTPEELQFELQKQVEIAKRDKISLREKYEGLKKKLWLVLLIINLILFLPDVPEKVAFYEKMVSEAIEIAQEKSKICFTIKDRNCLKEAPNTNANKVLVLPYDTPLEILEDIPRWYQVKYTDENGLETIGWISKICVEKEN